MSKEIDQHILQFYQTKKLLGSGAYGHVWKAIDRRTHKQYALKKIFDAFQNSIDAQRTYRQITILTQLEHTNIVKLQKAIRARNNRDLYLVFEFMQADLHSLVGEQVLQGVHLKFITYQILRAMKYLHSAQLLHRDLKPSNILINSQCEIKICDFGLARTLTCEQNQEMILSEQVATRWYRSPEMLLGSRHYDKSTDVWSIGCIIGELLMGKPMFPGNSTLHQLQLITEFTGVPSKESVDSLQSEVAENLLNQLSVRKRPLKDYFGSKQPQLVNLVLKMLQFNPNKRITVDQALNAVCFQQFGSRQEQGNLFCSKFIVPCVDDNVKLSMQQYRQIIYQDIQRRYPEQNNAFKNCRSNGSFTRGKNNSLEDNKFQNKASPAHCNNLKRQKSLIINKKTSSSQSILKKLQNVSPKTVLAKQEVKMIPKGQQNVIGLLKKTKSKKLLVKKKCLQVKSNKFKK